MYPMVGAAISILTKVGTWAAAVEGAHVVAGVVRKNVPKTPFGAMVAGTGDMITNILDPLDLTGTRARKEEEAAKQLAMAKGQTAKAKKIAQKQLSDEHKKSKEAEGKLNAALKKLEKAERDAGSWEKKAERLEAEGKQAKAKALRDRAQQAERYAKLALLAGQKAQAVKEVKPSAAAQFAGQALEFAKLAMKPPANAIEAINKETTDSGKSMIASLVDAINRPEEPNIEQLFSDANQGDPDSWMEEMGFADEDAVDGVVAGEDVTEYSAEMVANFFGGTPVVEGPAPVVGCGGGCSACKSGGACTGKLQDVPDNFIGGDFDDDDGDNMAGDMFPDIEHDYMDDEFYIGGPAWENGERPQKRNCEDGRCSYSGGETGVDFDEG